MIPSFSDHSPAATPVPIPPSAASEVHWLSATRPVSSGSQTSSAHYLRHRGKSSPGNEPLELRTLVSVRLPTLNRACLWHRSHQTPSDAAKLAPPQSGARDCWFLVRFRPTRKDMYAGYQPPTTSRVQRHSSIAATP